MAKYSDDQSISELWVTPEPGSHAHFTNTAIVCGGQE